MKKMEVRWSHADFSARTRSESGNDNVDAGLREKLILGISGAVTAIYRYFAPQRRRMAAELGAEGT
jgi:hypothetical protein